MEKSSLLNAAAFPQLLGTWPLAALDKLARERALED